MAQFQTKHGTLTIQLFDHPLIGRMIELRTDSEQLAANQANDSYVQSFITKAGNDKDQGMRDFFAVVFRAFNAAITKKFKDSSDEFTPVEKLLGQYQSQIVWNGEGFDLQEAP